MVQFFSAFTIFQQLSLSYIFKNSPYVQTTTGKISPPKKIRNKNLLLDMLVLQNTRKFLFDDTFPLFNAARLRTALSVHIDAE